MPAPRRGLWYRAGLGVSRRPAAVLAAAAGLGALAAGLSTVDIGPPWTEQFRTEAESVRGQEALARHFAAGTSQPVTVVLPSGATSAERVEAIPGVSSVGRPERSADGALVADPRRPHRPGRHARSGPGGARPARGGGGGLVGGAPAADLDQRDANLRDAKLIVPLVLGVVLLVLVVLLRSLLAPLLLPITVIASFAAALGAGAVLLGDRFWWPAAATAPPIVTGTANHRRRLPTGNLS